MVVLVSLIVLFSGLAGIVFHRPLARSMMKYYPEPEQPRMLKVMRIAYILIGFWMVGISAWLLVRALR